MRYQQNNERSGSEEEKDLVRSEECARQNEWIPKRGKRARPLVKSTQPASLLVTLWPAVLVRSSVAHLWARLCMVVFGVSLHAAKSILCGKKNISLISMVVPKLFHFELSYSDKSPDTYYWSFPLSCLYSTPSVIYSCTASTTTCIKKTLELRWKWEQDLTSYFDNLLTSNRATLKCCYLYFSSGNIFEERAVLLQSALFCCHGFTLKPKLARSRWMYSSILQLR